MHWLDRWIEWETRHWRLLVPLIIGGVLMGLTVGGGLGWWWWQNAQAAVLAGQAAEHYPPLSQQPASAGAPAALAERCNKALPLYQRISEDYSFSRLTPLALYYQANCQVELGHADQAVPLYKQVIADASPTHDVVPLSAMRLAYLYAAQDKRPEAIEQLKWITQQPKAPNRDQAYYESGRLHEADGNRDAALAVYALVNKEFPKSPWTTEATARIKQLGGELPPPPAEPKPAPDATKPPAAP